MARTESSSSGTGTRRGLTDEEYRTLRRAASTHRADLVLRLGAEAGLGPGEMADLQPADVTTVSREGRDHYLLDLPDREAYLPRDVERDLRQYATSNDIAPSEPVFEVSPRRLQMLVSEVSEAASADHPELADVSSSDLRATFARRSLSRGITPTALLAAGHWSQLDGLAPYLPPAEAVDVVEAFRDSDSETAPSETALDDAEAVATALVGAGETAEVRSTVARALVDGEYWAAWVEPSAADGGFERAGAVDDAELDRVAAALTAETPSLHARARNTGDVQTTAEAGRGTVAVAPVPRSDGPDETLVVGADSVRPAQRRVLGLVGSLVGAALTATHQRHRRLSDTVLRATFTYDGSVLTALSSSVGASLSLTGVVPDEGSSLLVYVDVEDATPDAVLAATAEAEDVLDSRLVTDQERGARYELSLGPDTPLPRLASLGATLVDLSVTDSGAEVTVDIPVDRDLRAVRDELATAVSSLDLQSKRQVERSDRSPEGVRQTLSDRLTDRQAATLRAAYLGGYFEWPRESTAESLASSLDVSSPTLHQHLRKSLAKLLDVYFDTDPQA